MYKDMLVAAHNNLAAGFEDNIVVAVADSIAAEGKMVVVDKLAELDTTVEEYKLVAVVDKKAVVADKMAAVADKMAAVADKMVEPVDKKVVAAGKMLVVYNIAVAAEVDKMAVEADMMVVG